MKTTKTDTALASDLMKHVMGANLPIMTSYDTIGAVKLPAALIKRLSKAQDAMPGVKLTLEVSAKDIAKIRADAAQSCMTTKTKNAIAAALKGK